MFFIGRTDGRTHVQLKTIVRNLTKIVITYDNFMRKRQRSDPDKT